MIVHGWNHNSRRWLPHPKGDTPLFLARLSDRLTSTFTRDENGRRPVYGGTEKFQTDPHWRDLILFYEYFHADNGAGLGASHQTGWTGLVAKMIELDGLLDADQVLKTGKKGVFAQRAGKNVGDPVS